MLTKYFIASYTDMTSITYDESIRAEKLMNPSNNGSE